MLECPDPACNEVIDVVAHLQAHDNDQDQDDGHNQLNNPEVVATEKDAGTSVVSGRIQGKTSTSGRPEDRSIYRLYLCANMST